jgi:LAO/AO transport system kinase
MPVPSSDLVDRVLTGEMAAIARLLSRAERGDAEVHPALGAIYRHAGRAHVVGITGVPGCGKSSLVARLARVVRDGGRKVAVVAMDPSSPFSGGSILGDRIRMNELTADPGIFIRSMATHGSLGGLARSTLDAVDILDSAGFDLVLIETVGVGQDEIDVVQAAHSVVVVSAPGLGDDIQAIKAGILEIADIHVVSKSDRSDANKTVIDLKAMMTMGAQAPGATGWQVPVLATSAVSGEGIDELVAAIDSHLGALKRTDELAERRRRIAERRLLKSAEQILRAGFDRRRDGCTAELVERMMRGEIDPHAAARKLLNLIDEEEQG